FKPSVICGGHSWLNDNPDQAHLFGLPVTESSGSGEQSGTNSAVRTTIEFKEFNIITSDTDREGIDRKGHAIGLRNDVEFQHLDIVGKNSTLGLSALIGVGCIDFDGYLGTLYWKCETETKAVKVVMNDVKLIDRTGLREHLIKVFPGSELKIGNSDLELSAGSLEYHGGYTNGYYDKNKTIQRDSTAIYLISPKHFSISHSKIILSNKTEPWRRKAPPSTPYAAIDFEGGRRGVTLSEVTISATDQLNVEAIRLKYAWAAINNTKFNGGIRHAVKFYDSSMSGLHNENNQWLGQINSPPCLGRPTHGRLNFQSGETCQPETPHPVVTETPASTTGTQTPGIARYSPANERPFEISYNETLYIPDSSGSGRSTGAASSLVMLFSVAAASYLLSMGY
ncbi:MAG: hypothetical protein ACR2PT_14845, partial [Endozoicomonas sp.]